MIQRGAERLGKRKQQYHLEPDRGLLNDPNGLAYFKGTYYVFFQWNRFFKDHSYKEWGLFTSKDMIRWNFEGSALLPDQCCDKDGVYSGSGFVINNRLCLFYTGNTKKQGVRKSYQCMAVSDDGRKFLKLGSVLETPPEYTEHFRDPKVLKTKNNGYYMVIGGQRRSGKGALAICHSDDGLKWKYTGMPAVTERYEMIECPDLFKLGEKYILLYNPQSRDNEKDIPLFSFSAAKIIDFNEENGTFSDNDLDQNFVRMDQGFDFYAPQTFEDGNGRRILYAWMSRMDDARESLFAEGEPNIHCLTLPRELKVKGGRLLQMPVRELRRTLGKEVKALRQEKSEGAATGEYATEYALSGRAFYILVNLENAVRSREFRIIFHGGESALCYHPEDQLVVFTRKNWVTGEPESRKCRIGEFENAEIWADQSSMEIFINSGETVFTSRIWTEKSEPKIEVSGILEEMQIEVHEINKEIL